MNFKTFSEVIRLMDAASVDLKAASETFNLTGYEHARIPALLKESATHIQDAINNLQQALELCEEEGE